MFKLLFKLTGYYALQYGFFVAINQLFDFTVASTSYMKTRTPLVPLNEISTLENKSLDNEGGFSGVVKNRIID